jgi:thiamine biosynthesis lipoprotein
VHPASIPLILALATAAQKPAAESQLVRLERSLDCMGTTYTVAVYGLDRFALDSAVEAAFEEAERLDGLLSNYRAESEWSRVNREALNGPVKVSGELFELLAKCQQYSQASEGAFDITVGPLMKIWGFYKQDGRIPHRAEIRQALGRVGWKNIQLDRAAGTVRFTRPIEMDPGGIGKGYAVDRMIEVLKKQGVERALISAGRSSIYGLGAPPSEPRGWRVLIPDPRDQRKTVAEVFLRNESMSTSGTSEKFFVAGGKTHSHIMDPRSGYPAQGMLAVSVIAPKTIDSEAWTKPFFVRGREWALRNRPKEFRVFLCEDRLETACVSLP